jgi:hypothetical protein
MTDRENFLERWSRRKHEAESGAEPPPRDQPLPQTGDSAAPALATPKPVRAESAAPANTPPFDLASLPSLDSITAASDVRAFLTPGVPQELTRAALRRAWVADPAIRDFVGLADYDWDFTKPDSMAGFGELAPEYDVTKLVEQLFGHAHPEVDRGTSDPSATPEPPAPAADASQAPVESGQSAKSELARSGIEESGSPPSSPVVQSSNTVASQNSSITVADNSGTRLRHGGALPE